jgi:hypothetical protein
MVALSPHHAGRCVMSLTNGLSGAEEMPASAKNVLDSMEKAIKEDTETAKHNQAMGKIRQNARETELLNMATDMAARQMHESARRAYYINNIGYLCVKCKQHPYDCSCNAAFIF